MNFKMVHENYNVADLERSMAFYEKALGLHEVRRKNGEGLKDLSSYIWEIKKAILSWN